MTREKKLLLNTVSGIVRTAVTIICGFILPRYLLLYYGSAVNGLLSSITRFLEVINLLDMGVGAVITANLYKPLAEKDHEQLSRIYKSARRFFSRLAYIFLAYIFVLCFVFPLATDTEFSPLFSGSLLIIISISTFAQYLFGITNQLLLTADQKVYIPYSIIAATTVLNTVFSVILIKLGVGVHVVKLVTAAIFVLRPLAQEMYVRRHYPIDRKIQLVGEPIKQKWNGFAQHLAAVVVGDIDVVVLTLFSTLENVSIYSVYFLVLNGLEQLMSTSLTGLTSLFGNMIANDEDEHLKNAFSRSEWLIHFIVTVVFTITAIMIVPFVRVYTKGVNDADYANYLFGLLMVIAYAALCLRHPYFVVIRAAGHFKETQNGAFISAGINVAVTVALVFRYGLIGAAIGTIAAMVYHTCYCVWYLMRNILNLNGLSVIKLVFVDAAIFALGIVLTKQIGLTDLSWLSWVIMAVKSSVVVIVIAFVVNSVFYRNMLAYFIGRLKRRYRK